MKGQQMARYVARSFWLWKTLVTAYVWDVMTVVSREVGRRKPMVYSSTVTPMMATKARMKV